MDDDLAPQPQPQPQNLPIRFVGSGSEYFRIWAVNLLLTLVTLGLYYPFAKVRRLKYFHGATEVGGHPLSFHAEPWKMLRGYLLVGVLVGLYSVAGRVSAAAGLVAFLIVAGVWPALWHSSLRFRLANTGWRGLRFRFTGTRGAAYRALLPLFVPGLLLLAAVWLGQDEAAAKPPEPGAAFWVAWLVGMLAFPAMLWSMKRYQHDHYALAGEQARFNVGLWAFYRVFLRGLGFLLLSAVALSIVIGVLVLGLKWASPSGDAASRMLFIGAMALTSMVIFQISLWPWFTARLQNLVWQGTRSQHIGFESRLSFRALALLTLKNWFFIVFTLGLYFPFAAVQVARLRLQAVTVVSSTDPDTLLSSLATQQESAAGDAAGDLLGIDIGL